MYMSFSCKVQSEKLSTLNKRVTCRTNYLEVFARKVQYSDILLSETLCMCHYSSTHDTLSV